MSLLEAVTTHCGGDVESAENYIRDNYEGAFDSETDFAYKLYDEVCEDNLHPAIKRAIDFEMFQDDIFSFEYFSVDVGLVCHIFSRVT